MELLNMADVLLLHAVPDGALPVIKALEGHVSSTVYV